MCFLYIVTKPLFNLFHNKVEDTSGHVSIASGGVTPLITSHTVHLPSTGTGGTSTNGSVPGKNAIYYLKLWAKVLKRKGNVYRIKFDEQSNKAGFCKRYGGAVVLWFSLDNVADVRNWYVNFRLCGDDFLRFIVHQRTQLLQDMGQFHTPPPELECEVMYK